MTKHTIALLYTDRSEGEKDLGKMIGHLAGVLAEVEGAEVVAEKLAADRIVDYNRYDHLVFCGYDFVTLGHIHLAMAATDPERVRITLYDEPGAAIDRELSAIVFRAIDLRRAPGSSATRLVTSWSHRDIVSTARQDVLRLAHGAPQRPPEPTPSHSSTPARSGKPNRSPRARKVDAEGETSAREGDVAVGDGTGSKGDKPVV